MTKLQRLEENNHSTIVEHNEDGDCAIALSDGTPIAFRAPTIGDIRAIRNQLRTSGIPPDDEVELAVRLAARTCIKFGSQSDANLSQLDALSVQDFQLVSKAMAPFLGESQATTTTSS
jgi:hypothetical protein